MMVVMGGVPGGVPAGGGTPELSLAGQHAPAVPPGRSGRLSWPVWLVAAVFTVVELAVSDRYGFHRDELYFVAAARLHPAAGYVDQPPLAPMLTRVATFLLGTSPAAVRVFPALAGAGVIAGTAAIARVLGGGRLAQLLAAVAAACCPVVIAAAHLANTTIYDMLAWTLITLAVLTALTGDRPRAWLAAGAAAGLGLENNGQVLLLALALAIGLAVTGRWRVAASRWLWCGAAIAVVLWLPNLIWQAGHGWPQLAMASALRAEHSAPGDYLTVIPAEILYPGLATLPLVVLGLRRLARDRSLRFTVAAAGFIAVFVVVTIPGRPYYVAGILPVIFAAGAVTVEERRGSAAAAWRWLSAPVALAVLSAVWILPILPEATVAHIKGLHKLTYDLPEQIGWPQFAAQVAGVYHRLPPAQRRDSSIFTSNYGEAAVLQVYRPAPALPPVLSGHNSYWLWGPGHAPDGTVIAVNSVSQLRPHFRSCAYAATFRSPHGIVNDENGIQIWVCTGPRGPWHAFWPSLRSYG